MHLYNLSLLPPTSITNAIVGNFSGTKQQEIVVSKGSTRLELLRPDPSTQKIGSVLATEVFGTIRSLASFRLNGGNKDYIIIGSDSGRIVVLEFDSVNNAFVKLHQETYGKSGSRRVVPGQYLAVDPRGRSLMIGAMEKSKLVYILNRDAAANLTISSPLEAHKAHAIIHSIVGVDVGFENPLFAALEVDYAEADQDPTGEAFNNAEKMLTYYELDLGLNHVVRRWSEPTDPRANMLITVPGGQSTTSEHFDGPSGVLVCAEDYIIYKHQDAKEHRVPIPRREHPFADPNRGLLITASVMHKMKGDFFFLLQSEEGDLYKVTIDRDEEEVKALKIKYFDTVPVATSLCILKSGFLFVASEFGNHHFYQFLSLVDEGDEVSSADYADFGMAELPSPVFFKPRPLNRPEPNLALVDELDSLNPIIDSKILNVLGADTPQILTACGRGARSTYRMLRQGLEIDEVVNSPHGSDEIANGVWTVKASPTDMYDSFALISFPSRTLILKIDETIESMTAEESGFFDQGPTLGVENLGEFIIQVHRRGLRLISPQHGPQADIPPPGAGTIICAALNARQVCIALSNHEIYYYELDPETSELNVCDEKKELGVGIACMSVGPVPEGRLRFDYLAVGCEDSTIRIISLVDNQTHRLLESVSIQALSAPPSSLCIAEMKEASIDKVHDTTFLNIGLQNGVYLRTVLDSTSGQLTDTRMRFLGSRPVKVSRVVIRGAPAILALSSRPWLNYLHQGFLQFTPLVCEPLEHAWSFSNEFCPDGIIGTMGSGLRIFAISKMGEKVKQDVVPLSYTPRRLAIHPSGRVVYTIEADHRTLSAEAKQKLLQDKKSIGDEIDEEIIALPNSDFGLPRAESGNWASRINVIDAQEVVVDENDPSKVIRQGNSVFSIELDNNEAAFSVAVVPFISQNMESFLVVGTASNTYLAPRSCSSGFLRTYRFVEEGRKLELVHKTEVDDVPTALLPFQGRLLAGVGRALRILDMGKKKLLRKVENKSFATSIATLNTQGSRILVGDMQDSVHYCVYKPEENRLLVFADDTQPRWTTSSVMVDYETVAAGDKFGNIFFNRLSKSVSEDVDNDPTGAGIMHEKGILMGAPHKTTLLAHFNVGDIVTSLHKVAMVPGGRDVLLYTGFSGRLGVMIPFISREDVDFFQTLEMHMRSEASSLVGRDHLAYRGYYVPQKAIVDGDLCEAFSLLPMQKQATIAGELDRTVSEVLKKLEQIRVTNTGW